jgi:hypothetical protein
VAQPLNLKCDLLVSKFAAFKWVNLCTATAWAMRQPHDDGGGGGGGGSGGGGGGNNVSIIPGTNKRTHQLANLGVAAVSASLTLRQLEKVDALGAAENLGGKPKGWRDWKNVQH